MASIQIVYWRDIPAQVIAKAGRKTAKRQLDERFEKAIDMAAMRSGAASTDDYLADWRRGEAAPCGDDLEAAAAQVADDLETTYDTARLRSLIDAGGYQDAEQKTGTS